jgi:anthranilate phosphoribosyltransferase
MRFAGKVRGELGVATTFNFLGPLANPAGATRRTVGVSDPGMARTIVGALARLGVERALVFYGHDGLDELTTTTTSTVLDLDDGAISEYEVDPTSLGLRAARRDELVGGDPTRNAEIARRVLSGEPGPVRDVVALNAAAALVAAGSADDLAQGLELAFAIVDDGRAAARLEAFIDVSVAARAAEAA